MARSMNAADIHLGYQMYGSNERYNDFGRAFSWLIDEAIRHQICCLRISGDLFHGTVEARTLHQATAMLRRAKEAGITVFCIHGNHDRARYSDRFSWLDYLVEQELLILLDAQFQDGDIILHPWNQVERYGSYFDCPICQTRTIGVRWHGAQTAVVVGALGRALAAMDTTDRPYTVVMLHAGIEGMLPQYAGGLTMAEVEALRPHVDWLALGHIHRDFVVDDWIYNPGSLESCSIDEAAWTERGYFLLEIDADRKATVTQVSFSGRRGFVQVTLGVDTFRDPEALYCFHEVTSKDHAMLRAEEMGQHPVVELRLQGSLRFDRSDLDLSRLEQSIKHAYQPIVCRIRDLTESQDSEIVVSEATSRAGLERDVIRQLVCRDPSREAQADDWMVAVQDLLDMGLRRTAPEGIIEETQNHIGRIRQKEVDNA